MKRFKFSIAWLAVFALVFTSCSEEDPTTIAPDDQEKIQITFGSLLNDMTNDLNKQAAPGECREGDPAYVHVGITDAVGNYVGTGGGTTAVNLIEVDLKWNSAMSVYETVYSNQLALEAGDYQLEHFIVYDAGGDVLWVAPRVEGAFGDFATTLPQPIDLVAGTKPYITVDVICYEARNEEAYGYVFFDIDLTVVENSYCIFINYCDDETGREYPAYFSVEVWRDGYDGADEVELSMDTNMITMAGGLPSASVFCVPLPRLLDNEVFYVRATVENHDDLAYTAGADDYYQWTITQADIDGQEMFVPAYQHLRINCDPDDGGGEDETCEIDVACQLEFENPLDENCYFTELEGANADDFVMISSAADLELLADVGGLDGIVALATVDASVTDNEITIDVDTPFGDSDTVTAWSIEVRPSVEGGGMSSTCWESNCGSTNNGAGVIPFSFDGFAYEYPFYVRVNTVNCFEVIAPE